MRPGMVVRDGDAVGSSRLLGRAPVQGSMFGTEGRDTNHGGLFVFDDFQLFAGIDWGSEKHRVCLMNREGEIVAERWVEHSGASLAELVNWLRQHLPPAPASLAAAIEIPRGVIVETLLEHGVEVFSINPKQLDRLRDRYSPAGAKDGRRGAFVLADSLRTDMHCFRAVRLGDPVLIRLRELSRLDDELAREQTRTIHRLREQLHRFFPQLLQLSDCADEPWLWDLFEMAPSPLEAAWLTEARIARLLKQHRMRRITAVEVRAVLRTKPLTLAPGAAEAAAEHALWLLPRLRLLHQQRTHLGRRINTLLDELATPAEGQQEHRDATILLSLPGLGRKAAANDAQRGLASHRRARLSRASLLQRNRTDHPSERQQESCAHASRQQRTVTQRPLSLGSHQRRLGPSQKENLCPNASPRPFVRQSTARYGRPRARCPGRHAPTTRFL